MLALRYTAVRLPKADGVRLWERNTVYRRKGKQRPSCYETAEQSQRRQKVNGNETQKLPEGNVAGTSGDVDSYSWPGPSQHGGLNTGRGSSLSHSSENLCMSTQIKHSPVPCCSFLEFSQQGTIHVYLCMTINVRHEQQGPLHLASPAGTTGSAGPPNVD